MLIKQSVYEIGQTAFELKRITKNLQGDKKISKQCVKEWAKMRKNKGFSREIFSGQKY